MRFKVGNRVRVTAVGLAESGREGVISPAHSSVYDHFVLLDGDDLVGGYNEDELELVGTIVFEAEVDQHKEDIVNHPSHYTSHPSGIEVIQITEHENFCIGNAVKYLLRADLKGNPIQDLEKARWYVDREINRRKKENA